MFDLLLPDSHAEQMDKGTAAWRAIDAARRALAEAEAAVKAAHLSYAGTPHNGWGTRLHALREAAVKIGPDWP